MSLIINFFGGPGIGKSSIAAGLFSEMKKDNKSVELTYEFPKVITWEENKSAIRDQFYITANQHRNISRLYGKVDYIIVDSPIILGLLYKTRYDETPVYPSMFYDETFDEFVVSLFKKYRNLNIFLERNEGYDPAGRFQDYEDAINADSELKNILIYNNIDYLSYPVHTNTSKDIYEYILRNE